MISIQLIITLNIFIPAILSTVIEYYDENFISHRNAILGFAVLIHLFSCC